MKKVEIGWDESEPMLHNVDIKLEIGMRPVILGPNGAGKSTLMRAMAGRGGVLSGSREVGDGVEIGVFTQDLAQDLPGHLSALNFVLRVPILPLDFCSGISYLDSAKCSIMSRIFQCILSDLCDLLFFCNMCCERDE